MNALRSLRFTTAVDLAGFSNGMSQMEALADSVASGIGAKLASIKAPALDLGGGGAASLGADAGKGLADGVGSAIGEIASQVQAGMQTALAPIAGMVARVAVQFEAMAGSVLATNRRLDNDIKFEKTQAALAKVRTGSASLFGWLASKARDAAGRMDQDLGAARWVNRFAAGVGVAGRGLDFVFGGTTWYRKYMNNLESMIGLNKKAAREIANIKAPSIDLGFVGKLTGVTPLMQGIGRSTQAATGSFRAFGVQALAALGFVGVGYKAVGFLSDGIKDASDLNEAINKTNVMLGAAQGQSALLGDLGKM